MTEGRPSPGAPLAKRIGLVAGPAATLVLLALPAPEGMNEASWRLTAAAVLMAVWWITEALPVAATALVPIALFPLLGIAPVERTTAPYANPLIFLFLGGFVIALAMERWRLHRRIALGIVRMVGTRPDSLVGGFMVATALLSMWVSNTATAVMMLPIALSLIALVHDADTAAETERPFATALLLSVAYAASIGGLATLIGTPPNALLAAFLLQNRGIHIGFAQWMVLGLPLAILMLGLAWLLLTRVLFPLPRQPIKGAAALLDRSLKDLGPVSREEKAVALIFSATALAWLCRPLITKALPELGLSDAGIAMIAALALFVTPVRLRDGIFLIGWEDAKRLPWGVLILFGGGLSLAAAVNQTGLAAWIGQAMQGAAHWPSIAIVVGLTTVVVFLTELTSNTATAATFLPLAAALAVSVGLAPEALAVPAALAASCAFMMPVATPPNAIVFGSGYLTVAQMARAGFWLNLVAIVVIVGLGYALIGAIIG